MILVWIILIAWGLWLAIPYITKWAVRRVQKKMQDRVFRSMGLNPDDFRENQHPGNRRQKKTNRSSANERRQANASGKPHKIIPEGYGEYVKFTVLTITGTEPWLDTSASPIYVKYTETQITDVRRFEIID